MTIDQNDRFELIRSWIKRLMSPYSTIMSSVLSNYGFPSQKYKLSSKTFQNVSSASTGNQYFLNKYTNHKATFNILSHLNDDSLKDIPEPQKTEEDCPSLFQVFQIILPNIQEQSYIDTAATRQHIEENAKSSVLDYQSVSLPDELNIETINRSYSAKVLNDASKMVLAELEHIKLQKSSVKSEIANIREKLASLHNMEKLMAQRIKMLDRAEIQLKNSAVTIKTRKEFVKEYGLAGKDDCPDGPYYGNGQDDSEDDILNKYLAESNSFIDDYHMEKFEKPGSLPSSSITSSPTLLPTFIPDEYTTDNTQGSGLSKFYDGPHRKQKFISESLQELYQPGTNVATFQKAHSDGISSLDFDFPFGTMITAGHMDHTMKIWDLSGRKQIGQLLGHMASVNCIEMDSSYNLAVSGSKDATLKLWNIDLATEKAKKLLPELESRTACLHSFTSHKGEIVALSLSGESLVSASRDKTIRQWDLKSGKCVQSLDVAFPSRDLAGLDASYSMLNPPVVGTLQSYENALATGSRDGLIRLWDLRIGKVVRTIPAHNSAVTALKFDTTHLITGSFDRTAFIWDLRTGDSVSSFSYDSPVSSVNFDEARIVISTDSMTTVSNRNGTGQWQCRHPMETHSAVSTSQYKDGHMIEGRSSGTVSVWSV
ncbi:Caf4p KNAG_0C01410 [Huiozyma naganishii CBS 8797]|uniref:Uncharacterized protein n=1 Tax=Huiozyma naganishii (strain ATCC MYA-139 / BCRC 22969 / CBS 8797 / KCTC 17520 / NBRC 10181 / NCYC 3082 / Yp74L-3) TaxID=1071383 RepID=J7S4E4_HUIN7|nr:hypothetical protein KNAG_0C01410 [Kazachstania naganishii CBS 8797]CCK69254.1 hypothetical protein KNAG_0C01410 [Kazachstania naganishii CBS 8797]